MTKGIYEHAVKRIIPIVFSSPLPNTLKRAVLEKAKYQGSTLVRLGEYARFSNAFVFINEERWIVRKWYLLTGNIKVYDEGDLVWLKCYEIYWRSYKIRALTKGVIIIEKEWDTEFGEGKITFVNIYDGKYWWHISLF